MKKRVLHITTCLDYGGVEKHLTTISENLSNIYEHCFLSITNGGYAHDCIKNNGLRVDCLYGSIKISISNVFKIFMYLRQFNPSVVHTHGSEANTQGLIASWLARVPVRIGEEIGIPKHSLKARIAFRISYFFAQRVIGVSNAVSEFLINSKEVPSSKIVTLYNPVKIPEFLPLNNISKFPIICCVGRLENVKNQLSLLEAFVYILKSYPESQLWLIGDGSQRNMLIQSAIDFGISQSVFIYGFKPNPDFYIRRSTLYVQPSLAEGFGLALVEAMCTGVPVLATSVGGAPEIIEHNLTGWLIDRTDPESLSFEILKILKNDKKFLDNVGLAGKKSVESRFTPCKYIISLDLLYNEIL